MKYFIGIDIGTSVTKGTIVSESGTVVGTSNRQHNIIIPKPGYAEHDPQMWWEECCSIIKDLIVTAGITNNEITGICCSAIACGLVAVDENDEPLRNAILYGIDTRSIEEISRLNAEIGEDIILDFCSEALSVESFGPKILWIKEHEPEIFRRTEKFTFVQGFVNLKLCGNNCIDRYSAVYGLPMYDYRTGDWNDEMCKFVVPRRMLPVLHNSRDIIGYVTEKAALETGLKEGTPVICGATDAGSEALSAGVAERGDIMVMYGSTIFIAYITDRLYVRDNPLWKASFLLPNTYSVLSGMATAGSLTKWILDVMGKDIYEDAIKKGENEYSLLFSGVNSIAPGADGLMVLPYFAGERMPIKDPLAKGMLFGLSLSHNRNHIVRACLEGIGYALSQNLDTISSMGLPINEITAIGGGSKSLEWMQIMADITGYAHKIYTQNMGASYGDAMLAALGTGNACISDIKKWNSVETVIYPNNSRHEFYNSKKELFKNLYLNNVDAMHQI